MSSELESDRAIVMNLESFGVDGVGYDETDSETEPPGLSGHGTPDLNRGWGWTPDSGKSGVGVGVDPRSPANRAPGRGWPGPGGGGGPPIPGRANRG
jgi:hypothetical protein